MIQPTLAASDLRDQLIVPVERCDRHFEFLSCCISVPTLNYLVIQNPPAPSGSSSTSSASIEHKGAAPTGSIVGGALGGGFGVAVIVFLLLLRRHHKIKYTPNRERLSPNGEPFNTPATVPVSIQQFSAGSNPGGETGHVPQRPSNSTLTTPTASWPPTHRSPNYFPNQFSGSHANYNSTPGNLTSREAGEFGRLLSANLLSAQHEIRVPSNSYSPSDAAPRDVLRHEDSGVRLPPQKDMLELPPLYTPL
jgi:hypothetical protein